METTYISKLTLKDIGCKPAKTKRDDGPVSIAKIYGKATGIATGENKDGTIWNALTGTFGAVNLQFPDEKEYRSGKLFLPGGIHQLVESGVKSLQGNDIAVEFALELMVADASNPIGYSYQAKNLIEARATDDLGTLREQIFGKSNAPAQIEAAPAAVPVVVTEKKETANVGKLKK